MEESININKKLIIIKKMDKKSEVKLLSDFRNAVCEKNGDPCPHWDRGCRFQNSCRKLTQFRYRAKKKEKEEELKLNTNSLNKGKEVYYESLVKLNAIESKLNTHIALKRQDRFYLIGIYELEEMRKLILECKSSLKK